MLVTTAPILPARSFDETAEFYAAIGFRVSGRWDNHDMIAVMDEVELHFFGLADLDVSTSFAAAYIRSSDVDALNAKATAIDLPTEGIPRFHPVEDKDWGMREMAIIDPNGTLLRIGQFVSHG